VSLCTRIERARTARGYPSMVVTVPSCKTGEPALARTFFFDYRTGLPRGTRRPAAS
jgi:hypothetical protein